MEKEFRGPVLVTEDITNNRLCKCKYSLLKKRGDITVASPKVSALSQQ